MKAHARFIHLLVWVALLLAQTGSLPVAARTGHDEEPPALTSGLPPGATTLANSITVIPPTFDSALDVAPAEADALVVDPHNSQWVVRYGSELGRQTIPATMAPAWLAPEGPTIPIGGWADTLTIYANGSHTLQVRAVDTSGNAASLWPESVVIQIRNVIAQYRAVRVGASPAERVPVSDLNFASAGLAPAY